MDESSTLFLGSFTNVTLDDRLAFLLGLFLGMKYFGRCDKQGERKVDTDWRALSDKGMGDDVTDPCNFILDDIVLKFGLYSALLSRELCLTEPGSLRAV